MVTKYEMQKILYRAKKTGGDFAELFFEEQDETNICCSNGSVDGVKTKHLYGVGLYVLKGIRSVYVYSNDKSFSSLLSLADKASEMISEDSECDKYKIRPLNKKNNII